MIRDNLLLLDENNTITSTASSTYAVPSELVPLGASDLGCLITVNAAPAAGGTYSAALVTTATATLTASPTTLGTVTIPATAAVGSSYWIPFPDAVSLLGYVGTTITLGGASPSLDYSAFICRRSEVAQEGQYFPKNYTSL